MAAKEEILLTKDEIVIITDNAKRSLISQYPGMMMVTKNWWDVMHITPLKKLLFIEGHDDTGLKHINRRHRYYTNEHSPYKDGFIITSRFAPNSGTLDDYTKLVDFLYDDRYRMTGKENKRPELFDVFKAKVEFKERSEFCLIVYKDSKIIHTLFPLESNRPFKKYKKQDYLIEHSDSFKIRGLIPYTDRQDKIRFGIGITMYIKNKKEDWSGLVFKDDTLIRNFHIGEMAIEYRNGYQWRIEAFNCDDLSKYENAILDLITKENL